MNEIIIIYLWGNKNLIVTMNKNSLLLYLISTKDNTIYDCYNNLKIGPCIKNCSILVGKRADQ